MLFPCRKVVAQTVAEAIIDIFSRCGLPNEMLTDLGSISTGSLMREMCNKLQIQRIKTSPYHSQSDGMLERMHAKLKSMLRKATAGKRDWDELLLYCLFATDLHHTLTWAILPLKCYLAIMSEEP